MNAGWDSGTWDDATWDYVPTLIDDTHDGDYLKDRFAKEKAVQEERRREVVALY
jgi:hypothetical protein